MSGMDYVGPAVIIQRIRSTIGQDAPVYVSIDIDVFDPAFAPGTSAPETGGCTSRELMKVMTVLSGFNVVGVGIVKVTAAYDSAGGDPAFAAANLAYEAILLMVQRGMERDGSAEEPVLKAEKREL
ncbi:agmatinase precursor [Metarhizium brunneum]